MMFDEKFKLEEVSVSKIENGFLIEVEGQLGESAEKYSNWKSYKVYVATVEELSNKLNEIFE